MIIIAIAWQIMLLWDIESVSPETKVTLHTVNFSDPWDFEEVYSKLFDWCQQQEFDGDKNDYLFSYKQQVHTLFRYAVIC